jgi:hypothetical protein
MQHLISHAAQHQAGQAAASVGRHCNQIGARYRRHLKDLLGGVAAAHQRRGVQPLLAQSLSHTI